MKPPEAGLPEVVKSDSSFLCLLFRIKFSRTEKSQSNTDKRIYRENQIGNLFRCISGHDCIQNNIDDTAGNSKIGIFNIRQHGKNRHQNSEQSQRVVQQQIACACGGHHRIQDQPARCTDGGSQNPGFCVHHFEDYRVTVGALFPSSKCDQLQGTGNHDGIQGGRIQPVVEIHKRVEQGIDVWGLIQRNEV